MLRPAAAAAAQWMPRPIITAHGCKHKLIHAEDAGTAAELHALLWRRQDAAAAGGTAAAAATPTATTGTATATTTGTTTGKLRVWAFVGLGIYCL